MITPKRAARALLFFMTVLWHTAWFAAVTQQKPADTALILSQVWLAALLVSLLID